MSQVFLERITREEICNLLKRWVLGEVKTGHLVDFASDATAFEQSDIPPAEKPVYDIYSVLELLSLAFAHPLYRQDAFALIRFLTVSEFDRKAANEELDAYLDSIDFQERTRREAEGSGVYEPQPKGLTEPSFSVEEFDKWLNE